MEARLLETGNLDKNQSEMADDNASKNMAPGSGTLQGRPRRKAHSEKLMTTEHRRSNVPFVAGQKVVLEEPFSESDEETEKVPGTGKLTFGRTSRQHHLSLPLPMQRTRTLSGTIPPVGYSPVWGGPTMCLKCLEFFNLPDETNNYVEHLIERHQIVIAEIDLIVDLKRYVEYWRHRFGQEDIDVHFPKTTPTESSPLYGRVDSYYLMSCKVKEDRQIREKLAVSRLEEVIACQQRERTDKSFCRQCLFCRYIVHGNRAKYIHHLYLIHQLNLGSPDNLVFVSEYIDSLANKISNSICLYCEVQFEDYGKLMDHIRSSGHREVNPKNNTYDKFYLINYLELGKKWQEVMAEDFEDVLNTFSDSDEDSENDTWLDWIEDGENESCTNLVCLLCDKQTPQLHDLLTHQIEQHNFDLQKAFDEMSLQFYDRVKFVNYIRQQVHKMQCFVCGKRDTVGRASFVKHLTDCCGSETFAFPDKSSWDHDEYFIPVYENDYLLTQLDEISGKENSVDKMLLTRRRSSTIENQMYSVAEPDTVTSEAPPLIEHSILADKSVISELS